MPDVYKRQGYIRLKIRELLVRNKELSADFMKCSGPILGASLVWGIGFTSVSYTHLQRQDKQKPLKTWLMSYKLILHPYPLPLFMVII